MEKFFSALHSSLLGNVRGISMRRLRPGFTLVELLVVIAIIGILVGLLLPAVQAAREAARRTQCTNNVKNLALATVNFETTKKQYPGYQSQFGISGTGASTTFKVGTWVVALLPYLEQIPLKDEWDDPAQQANWSSATNVAFYPNIGVLKCPSDITSDATAENSYLANCGFYVSDSLVTSAMLGQLGNYSADPSANIARSTRQANGVFTNKVVGSMGYSGAKTSFDGMRDGTSATIVFSESLQADSWQFYNTSNDLTRAHVGMVWLYRMETPTIISPRTVAPAQLATPNKVNGDKLASQVGNFEYARPSSNHSSVVVAAMLDGSTKSISDEITYTVYQALMSPQTKQSDVPNPTQLLKEDDYQL